MASALLTLQDKFAVNPRFGSSRREDQNRKFNFFQAALGPDEVFAAEDSPEQESGQDTRFLEAH
jgi:hypothetical protein